MTCTIDRLLGYQSASAADMDDDDAGRCTCTIDRVLGYQSASAADMDEDDAGR